MNLSKYISIILLLFFAVALVQCSKEVAATEENIDLEMRNTSQDCVVDMPAGSETNTKKVDDIVLPGTTCPLTGLVVYMRFNSKFAFTDFILVIPDDPDCDDLNDYLNGLPEEERLQKIAEISEAVYDIAKLRILQEYADKYPSWRDIQNVQTFRALCKQLCEYYDPRCRWEDVLELDEEPRIDSRDGKGSNRKCWLFKHVSCGDGCCKTTANYVRNIYGKIVLSTANTQAFGPCENGPPQDWPAWRRGCFWGNIIGDCNIWCYPW